MCHFPQFSQSHTWFFLLFPHGSFMVPPTSQMHTFPNFCKVTHSSFFMSLTQFYHSSYCQIPGNRIKDKTSLTGSMDIWCFPTIFLTASNWYLSLDHTKCLPIPHVPVFFSWQLCLIENTIILGVHHFCKSQCKCTLIPFAKNQFHSVSLLPCNFTMLPKLKYKCNHLFPLEGFGLGPLVGPVQPL